MSNSKFIVVCSFLLACSTLVSGCSLEAAVEEEQTSPVESSNTKPIKTSEISQSDKTLKQFPQDVGWVNIKKDYGAKGDGVTDDTEAIRQALEQPKTGDYRRPNIIYFPEGTYLVSDTLQFPEPGLTCCVSFQGQGEGKTIIRLKDNAAGFDNTQSPKAVIRTKAGNAAFRYYIRDLSISVGSGNFGTIALDYISNNRGAVKNVTITSETGEGKIGLGLTRKWPGPSLFKNVTVNGFDYGIRVRHPEYGLTFEQITLKNQNVAGIENQTNTLTIRGLKSHNAVPVIRNLDRGLIIVLEADLQGGTAESTAIENEAYLYARDIKTQGYGSTIQQEDLTIAESAVKEYVSHPVTSLFDSPEHSLNLPIKETPEFHDNNIDNWANVDDYPSLQAALNSGKSTIYYPQGDRKLSGEIIVPDTVRKIVGFESFINLTQDSAATLKVVGDSPQPLIIEGLLLKNVTIEHRGKRPLTIKHTKKATINNFPRSGNLFLEDVQMDLNLEHPQNVWARQLNAETLHQARTKVSNNGGNLWILGIKTEGKGTVLETINGGKTELLGTLVYPVQKFDRQDKLEPAFINRDSHHSLIYSVSVHGKDRNYPIQIEETRDGKTKQLRSSELPNLTMPLFVGY